MNKQRKIGAILLVIGFILPLFGCGSSLNQRSPKEWLSLSYSGLEATDQYAFSGSISMKTADGLEFKPQTFEGKVVDHQQLTIQTSSEDPLHWNPVQVLGALNEQSEDVRILNEAYDPDRVTLQITENAAVTKEKWKSRLHEQLEQLGTSGPQENSAYKEEWMQEYKQSRKQLDDMLETMQTETVYELEIDRNRLLPLKMDEKTIFHYKHKGHDVSEARYTTVRFESFKGASSESVQ